VRPKDSWADGLSCRTPGHATVKDCQTPSGQIPRGQRQQGTDSYGGKDFGKRNILRRV